MITISSEGELQCLRKYMCRWHYQQAAWVAVTESWWDKRQRQAEIGGKEHRSSTAKSIDWSLQSTRVNWSVLLQHVLSFYVYMYFLYRSQDIVFIRVTADCFAGYFSDFSIFLGVLLLVFGFIKPVWSSLHSCCWLGHKSLRKDVLEC